MCLAADTANKHNSAAELPRARSDMYATWLQHGNQADTQDVAELYSTLHISFHPGTDVGVVTGGQPSRLVESACIGEGIAPPLLTVTTYNC